MSDKFIAGYPTETGHPLEDAVESFLIENMEWILSQDAVVEWSIQLLPDVNADSPTNLVPPATPPHGCIMIVTRNRQQRGIFFDSLPPTSHAGHRPNVLADAGARRRLMH